MRLLLDYSENKSIDLNVRNDEGLTALWLACYNGHEQIVKLLLEHPNSQTIDFNARDNEGLTALMLACCYGYREIGLFHRSLTRHSQGLFSKNSYEEIAKLLLEHSNSKNIDLNVRDNKGETALIKACRYGYQKIVKLLLDYSDGKNIDLNDRDDDDDDDEGGLTAFFSS